ncbi:MAG: restriction endonuclease [Syntrophales bacterium]|jgi:hypothetical protein|nr:restriction endonuclease [Syntrophales bacterium]
MGLIVLVGIGAGIWILVWIGARLGKASKYDTLKPRLDALDSAERALHSAQVQWKEQRRKESEEWEKHVYEVKNDLERIAKEKVIGFPWLAEAYADYFKLMDMRLADYLDEKVHPAPSTAAQIRKEIALKRREAERLFRIYKYQLGYYESLFPWLAEFREITDDDLIELSATDNNDEDEDSNSDPISRYLTAGEYNSLTREEKFQRALDRYWASRKTNWQIGRDYERYVGYLFEKNGWNVNYFGREEGLSDFGRDLIVTSGNQVIIVQCKYWAKHKKIHEKHIFQLYGTTIEYWISSMGRDSQRQQLLFEDTLSQNPVKAMLYTSTELSQEAKEFAAVLGVEYRENIPIVRYPSIKCNSSKIYHLPFDQQYDRTKIQDVRTEKYVETIHEAEQLGYRRAFRWRGSA